MKKSRIILIEVLSLCLITVSIFIGYGLSEEHVKAAGPTVTGRVTAAFSVTVDTANVLLEGASGETVRSTGAVGVNVKSNKNYDLSVKASNNLSDPVTLAEIPIGQLSWSNTGEGIWTPFATTDTTVVSNALATGGTGTNYFYDYEFSIPVDSASGDYGVTIIYTALQY